MTVDEFNNKWKEHLVEGFEGLEFNDNNSRITQLLDDYFYLFNQINPMFRYFQIKMKFGMARVYIEGLPRRCMEIVEDAINQVMKCSL